MQIKFEEGAARARNRLASRLGKPAGAPRPAPSSLRPPPSRRSTNGYSVLERRAPIDPTDDGFFLAIFVMVVVFTLTVGYTLMRHEHVAELTGLENLRPK